jgi:hypothetical protein
MTGASKPVCPALHGTTQVSANQAERHEPRLGVHEQSWNVRQDRARSERKFNGQAEIEIGWRVGVCLSIQETEQPTEPNQTSSSQNSPACQFQKITAGDLRIIIHLVTE